jgi:Flp pilus assembly protein TadG
MTRISPKPLQRLRRRREFLGDDRAVTAVEFALLGVPFFAIIAAILQTSVIFLASQVLESAVNDAARQIRTGQLHQTGATMSAFRNAVCDRLYGLFPDCAGLHIRVVEVTNFQSATVVEPVDPACRAPCTWSQPESFLPGAGRSVVLAQVYYRYPVIVQLGPLGMSNLPDGTRLMGTTTVFQNEPFTWSAGT